MHGFPPKEILGKDDVMLDTIGVRNGTLIKVLQGKDGAAAAAMSNGGVGEVAGQTSEQRKSDNRHSDTGHYRVQQESSWACGACTFINEKATTVCSMCGTPRTRSPPSSSSSTLCASRALSPALLVRRPMAADNSCLFTSCLYIMFHQDETKRRSNKEEAQRLRRVVAETIKEDPGSYSTAVLGMEPGEYVKWILDPKSWGGYIELCILAKHFGIDFYAIEVRSLLVTHAPGAPLNDNDNVGGGGGGSNGGGGGGGGGGQRRVVAAPDEGNDAKQSAFFIFDGIHYDPLALAADGGKGKEHDDVTIFMGRSERESALSQALALAAKEKENHQFTDLQNFALRCLTCQKGLKGQEDAMAHAQGTGHTNFAEYK